MWQIYQLSGLIKSVRFHGKHWIKKSHSPFGGGVEGGGFRLICEQYKNSMGAHPTFGGHWHVELSDVI